MRRFRGLISALRPRAFRAATWAYSRFRLGDSPRQGLRILMYHAIGTPIESDDGDLYSMTCDRFEKHMRYLVEHHRDRLVPLGQSALTGNSFRVALTFDDGYRDNLSVAAPLLVELGIPFTIFVCTGAVAERRAGFLRPEDVRELAGLRGATIGSHSISHPRLAECDDRRLKEELAGSKVYLEDLLGKQVVSISYPDGSVDRRVRDMAEHAGYGIGATSRFDINRPERDSLLLCRSDIWADDDNLILDQKLRGDWDWMRWHRTNSGQWA